MKFTAQQIAGLLNGTIEGDASAWVNNLSKIEEGKPNTISFLANPKYADFIYSTKASIVIINKDFIPENPISATLIRVDDAYAGFVRLLEMYNQVMLDKKGIEQGSFVDSTARLGKDVYVGAFAYIGANAIIEDGAKIYPQSYVGDHSRIGKNTTLFSGVKVYQQCLVGNDCTLHSGVIIGADGFGFAPNDASYKKVPQIGNVIIEDNVEIGSNTTVDRATLGSTIIRKGVKLDNLIQVGHNVEIGSNTVIAAQTGIAGSTKIGKDCMIGGQVGIVGHLRIADKVKIAAQSGVGHNIETEGEIVQGSPAFQIGDYKRSYVMFRKLPDLAEKINKLEKNTQN